MSPWASSLSAVVNFADHIGNKKKIFKGKRCQQTKIPPIMHAEDIFFLLEFVLGNSHFEVTGFLSRQLRGAAMNSTSIYAISSPPWRTVFGNKPCRTWSSRHFGVIWHERYLDNRFTLPPFYRISFPTTAHVSRVLRAASTVGDAAR